MKKLCFYKSTKLIVLITIVWSMLVGYFHLPFHAKAVNTHGIELATVGSYKELTPKDGYTMIQIESIPGELGAHLSEIEVDGVKEPGNVLGFSDYYGKTDRGWYFVDVAEAVEWVKRFGGNPNFIIYSGGAANVYSRTVSSTDVGSKMQPYQAYNLAELATASGGGGYEIGDNLVPRDGGYVSVGHFRTTQRPTGGVKIKDDQTNFKINDTVKIIPHGKDYSYYDRGIIITHLSVINKTTGRGYKSLDSNQEIRDNSGYLEKPSATSNPKAFEWTGEYAYTPTEDGLYEVTFIMTDRHMRSRQGSPTINESTPYTVQFMVGDETPPPPPDPPEEPEPPAVCPINQSSTKMDFQIVGNDVKDYSAVPSGGSSIMVEKNADITLFASKNGTFTMNGIELETGSGNNRKRGIGYFGSSGTYRIVFQSDDGKDCWEKTFQVKAESKEESCPIITISGTTYRNGDTVEVLPERTVYFRANFRNSKGDTETAYVLWDVTKPDGKTVTLPAYEEEIGGRTKIVEYPYYKLELPYRGAREVTLERGKQYKVKLNFKGTNWKDRPECAWEITLVVKDTACTITDQHKLKLKIYGSPPHPFSPGGEDADWTVYEPIYLKHFTSNPDGSYATNLSFSANAPGTWFVIKNNKRVPVSKALAANEKFDLTLPSDFDVGDWVTLEFESDIGCIAQFKFEIMSDRKCYNLEVAMIRYGSFDDYLWKKEVSRGETLHLTQEDFDSKYRPQFLTRGEKTEFTMHWLDPDTQQWTARRNGKWLSTSNTYNYSHYFQFPTDPDSGEVLEGLYKILFWTDNGSDENGPVLDCEGSIFLQIGANQGENLLVVKNSFTITPKDPQLPGTEATITFQVKNAGKTLHDTKLAVRWESSDKETVLDVNQFKPGETRKITVPTQYPQQSEDFIAHINPSRNKPENESIWTDNRAIWPVKVIRVIEPPDPPGGGEDFDGGEIGLELYDSDGRRLERLGLHADGVWEREPAKIEVVIDQTKINEGFQRTQQSINAKITEYKEQLEQFASEEGAKNIVVTAQPGWISDAKSMAVYTPAMLDLKVSGPGVPQQWQVSSSSRGGEYVYTGTSVPTQTTWRQTLQNHKYLAEINGFQIVMDYEIVFDLSFDRCMPNDEEEGDGEEICEASSLTRSMSGRYTITVTGGTRTFEVFEPNVTGSIHHTAEWLEYHARDRYRQSQPHDFYAGERILTQVELQDRHRHPVSGKYPVVESATSWIYETGKRQTLLQSRLSLLPITANQWRGPNYQASKLGAREVGVDTPLMGDKQRGFQKDASYAVYFNIQFRFGVNKGYPYANKQQFSGHDQVDYRIPFRIIANAWERQGIRNHTTQ